MSFANARPIADPIACRAANIPAELRSCLVPHPASYQPIAGAECPIQASAPNGRLSLIIAAEGSPPRRGLPGAADQTL